jgi:hypothetical protein
MLLGQEHYNIVPLPVNNPFSFDERNKIAM